MKIEFEVTEIRDSTHGDGRASAFPEGSAVSIVRLTPTQEDHQAACGDIIVAVLKDGAPGLHPRVTGPDGLVITPGSPAILQIG